MSPDDRRRVRQDKSKPLVVAFKAWLEQQLARVSAKASIAEEIRYGLNHWDGLTRFLDDGRIELDTNIVERGIRPIVITRSFCPCRAGVGSSIPLASLFQLQGRHPAHSAASNRSISERYGSGGRGRYHRRLDARSRHLRRDVHGHAARGPRGTC
jgi:Transposase IS66 family